MDKQMRTRSTGRGWVKWTAIIFIVVGFVAFTVPLVLQRINYNIAAKVAAETEAQMAIPAESDYKPVDYSAMQEGVTPSYTSEEKKEAEKAPGLLDELGLTGEPASRLLGIPSARAEAEGPASMRAALEASAKSLEEAYALGYDAGRVQTALAAARKQVENAFFLLTAIQPYTDTEILKSLQNQKVVDGLTQGDKIITAAREMIYNTLTELEKLLKQVEDLAAAVPSQGNDALPASTQLMQQMDTLSSYLHMAALHLPEDDYRAALAQHKKIIAALTGKADPEDTDDESQYAPIDVDPVGVKRSYLLEIPGIGVKVACFRSGSFNKMYVNMHKGAAMFPRAPEPNTVGNICISAHRTGTHDYFRNLNKVSVGDTIYFHTSHLGSFKYEVVKVSIIDNENWSVTSGVGYPALTLLSCQAYGGVSNAQRIVVRAKLVATAGGN